MARSDEDRAKPVSSPWPGAVVFDADGVLFDTAGHWRAARRALFAHHRRHFGAAEHRKTVGTGIGGTGRALADALGRPELAGELGDRLFALLSEQHTANPPGTLPGVLALGGELRGRVPIGVASNSPRALLDTSLDSTGLKAAFDAVVGADETAGSLDEPGVRASLGLSPGAAEHTGPRTGAWCPGELM